MKSDTELLQELDRYAAAFTVAAMVFESGHIEWVWSNDADRLADINSYLTRGAKLLGLVGLKINPAYRVLAESDRSYQGEHSDNHRKGRGSNPRGPPKKFRQRRSALNR
jgi:hypothetical protein